MDSADRSTQKDTSSSAVTSSLSDLIARLEKATEGSSEFDEDIALAVGWQNDIWMRTLQWTSPDRTVSRCSPPKYTSSIDAAMTLVPEGWHGFVRFGDWPPHDNELQSTMWSGDRTTRESFFGLSARPAATPAIALCIAALKARSLPAI